MKCQKCGKEMMQREVFVSTDALIRGYNYKEDGSDLIIKEGVNGKYIHDDYCNECDISFSMAGGIIPLRRLIE